MIHKQNQGSSKISDENKQREHPHTREYVGTSSFHILSPLMNSALVKAEHTEPAPTKESERKGMPQETSNVRSMHGGFVLHLNCLHYLKSNITQTRLELVNKV